MQVFKNKVFQCFYDRGSGGVFHDLEFHSCRFESSGISITRDPSKRSTIRNVRVVDCEEIGCALDTAIIEDVLVDGLKTSDALISFGAVFKHVRLQGRIDDILINQSVAPGIATVDEQRAFDSANGDFYQSVDWALDISNAEFKDCDIRGVPAKLIIRDQETQVVVRRENAMRGEWRKLDLSGTWWTTSIEWFLGSV